MVAAERVRAAVEAGVTEIAETVINVTVSIGIAEPCPGDSRIEDVYERADSALYAAKHAGKNCAMFGVVDA